MCTTYCKHCLWVQTYTRSATLSADCGLIPLCSGRECWPRGFFCVRIGWKEDVRCEHLRGTLKVCKHITMVTAYIILQLWQMLKFKWDLLSVPSYWLLTNNIEELSWNLLVVQLANQHEDQSARSVSCVLSWKSSFSFCKFLSHRDFMCSVWWLENCQWLFRQNYQGMGNKEALWQRPRVDFLNAVYFRQGLTCTNRLTNDLIDGS